MQYALNAVCPECSMPWMQYALNAVCPECSMPLMQYALNAVCPECSMPRMQYALNAVCIPLYENAVCYIYIFLIWNICERFVQSKINNYNSVIGLINFSAINCLNKCIFFNHPTDFFEIDTSTLERLSSCWTHDSLDLLLINQYIFYGMKINSKYRTLPKTRSNLQPNYPPHRIVVNQA